MRNSIKALFAFVLFFALLCACNKVEKLDEQKDYTLIKAMKSAENQSIEGIDIDDLENYASICEKKGKKGKYCLANALIGYKLYFQNDFDKSMIHLKKAELNLMYCDTISSFVYSLISKNLSISDTLLALHYANKALNKNIEYNNLKRLPYSYLNMSLFTKGDTANFYLQKSINLFDKNNINMVKAQFARWHSKELNSDTIIQYIKPYYNEIKYVGLARYLADAYIKKNMSDSANLYIEHLSTRNDFKNDYYICKAQVLTLQGKYKEACKWWDLAYNYNNEEWKFITNQRLGAINAEYDLLNAELQNEKRRVRMMMVYNMILVVLVALLCVAFIILKRYKRDIDVKEIDIAKRKERFNTLFEKHREDYKMDKDNVLTEAMRNLEKLHEAYPTLTRTEVAIIWLLFMKCSSDSICEVLNITHNYYYQRKSAIYRTFGIRGKDEGEVAIERIVKEYIFLE